MDIADRLTSMQLDILVPKLFPSYFCKKQKTQNVFTHPFYTQKRIVMATNKKVTIPNTFVKNNSYLKTTKKYIILGITYPSGNMQQKLLVSDL